ncbi:hypothetical protein PVAP13_3NG007600 [Panicum virgatum]|uniref:NAC domain-containing protein n=1 Tax=Panicum virgatum TaxID=38727 RepID=A0A8T0U3G1_PANVG|nr:hypothetical protein PVAP13_3NG007600 [Panicum virgatum]
MEQARWPDVPPCYRFTPTAPELIRCYLNPWVANPGQTPFGEPEGVVCAADVYSADPGTLTSRLRRFGHDDGNYGGTWHGSGKRIAVRSHGYRQTFEYRDAAGGKSAWLMEEFGTSMPEATDGEGVRVICRVHRTPRAAAGGDGGEEHQEETDEVQFRSSKRQRDTLNHEHDFAAADYWTTAAPPDAGCSYASTSQTTPVNNGAASTTTWQMQLMMEQGVGYHPTGINGGEDIKGEPEPEPLEMLPADMGWQQFAEMGYGFGYAAEDARMNEWMLSTFSCPQPADGAAQEGDDPRDETGAS